MTEPSSNCDPVLLHKFEVTILYLLAYSATVPAHHSRDKHPVDGALEGEKVVHHVILGA